MLRATIGIALNEFKATNIFIFLLDLNIFSDHLYLPSTATHIPEDETIHEHQLKNRKQMFIKLLNCNVIASAFCKIFLDAHSADEKIDVYLFY